MKAKKRNKQKKKERIVAPEKQTAEWFWKYCGYAALGGIAVMLGTLALQGFFGQTLTQAQMLRMFSDAFLIPGMLMICGAMLIMAVQAGALDALGYSLQFFFDVLNPRKDKKIGHTSYRDYVEHREAKEKLNLWFLIAVGGVFTLIAILFMLLYYSVKSGRM